MSWAERLRQFATGDPDQPVREVLGRLHDESAARAARLTAHAAQAPTAGSEAHLAELAAAEAALRDRLADALRKRDVEPRPVVVEPSDGARNHWARVVVDLEACREARDELARERADLLERDAGLAALIDALQAMLEAQADGLRTLIARADPQALN
jgi:hypothetical protein